ncbi:MAG: hypothetical protein LBH35_04475 [Treponema sp.]|jgi:hypothetical protein|nr:hypothetical protein [Treponema sp.]
MKNFLYVMVIFVIAVFAVSCSTPAPSPEPDPAPAPQQESFEQVYEAYADTLILDGALNHTVVRGNTLSEITQAEYGENNLYYFPLIMLASQTAGISDPDLIMPGMELTIPDLSTNLNNPGSRSQIKSFLEKIAGVYDRKNQAATAQNLRDLAATL